MASKLSEMFSSSDSKSRIFVVLATIVAIVGVVYVGSKMMGPSKATGAAKLAGAPSLQSVPGGNVTPEYYRALMKANQQSAKQAEITGTSAVPTLVNAPTETQSTTTTSNNCVVTCPGTEASVEDDVNAMVRDGKLAAADANQLMALARNNVPVSEYADYLTSLVKQGKLTPEQARKLLEDYTRQHATAASAPSAQMMDGLIKSGKMSLDAANQLLALQKQNASPAEYQAALDRLVREGKLSPDAAAQLMAQYNQQLAQASAQEGANQLRQMVKSGQITPDVADALTALQKRGASAAEYEAELNRLVAEGKLTPATAAKLLAQYKAQRTGLNGAATSSINPAAELADMVQTGEVPADVADDLLNLQKNNVPVSDYKAELDKLVAAGKISPATAAKLLQQYSDAHNGVGPAGTLNGLVSTAEAQTAGDIAGLVAAGKIPPDVASQLSALQSQHVSPEDYNNAVDALVAAGKLSPEVAQQLKDNYSKNSVADLVGAGKLSPDVANQLLALQKQNLSPEEYANAVDALVKAGKISPEVAQQLKDDYNNNSLAGLVRAGKISSDVAAQLADLQKQNVSPEAYDDAIDALVKAGKLSPAVAQQLKDAYAKSNLAALVASGKISPDVANQLLALQKQAMSPEDYDNAIDELVREGKIPPDVAQELKAAYAKNNLAGPANGAQLSPDVASQLSALQRQNVSPAEYASAVDALVRAGKISPEVAQQLKDDYNNNSLAGMVSAGKISPEVASQLADLQRQNVSPEAYDDAIDALVRAGKITPEVAQQLKDNYSKNLIGNLVSAGQLSPAAARQLLALQKQNVSPQAYANAIDALVRAGKLTPAAAQRLKDNYNKMYAMRAEAQKLNDLQASNVPVDAYKAELMRAVREHLIDPATAAKLLQQYQALMTPPPVPVAPAAGINPAINSNVPGAENFAILQQRVAAEQANRPVQTAAATNGVNEEAQFAQEEAAAEAEAMKEHQQRVQELMSQMTGQAQSLVAAWTPPHMDHKSGSATEKKGGGVGTGGGLTPTQNNAKNGGKGEPVAEKPPLLKAGSILFAVLTTAVDSDYPDTPVMATIVSGVFKGAVLLGKLALANGMDKVSLNFTMMNRDDWTKTKTVSAFAIDPDTARTVLASSVDNHYWLRYGTLFASSFVTGYASGISQSGSTTTSGIFGTSSTHPQLSPGEKFAVGLGQVGSAFGTALQSYVNTPTTVKVNSGVGLGILFMSDVTDQGDQK